MNRKINTPRISIFLSMLLFICLSACSSPGIPSKTTTTIPTPKPQATETRPIPASIIEKSNQFIVSKVGQEYFTKYITFNALMSRYVEATQGEHISAYLRNPYYLMAYSFIMPEKSFVNELIEFAVDINGNIIAESEPRGIPNLLKDPQEGEFPIDEQMAIDIAKHAGLEEGIRKWETSFHWYSGELKTYVWTVSNTLFADKGFARGETVIIDANTGIVLMNSGWNMIAN